jgi:hypothetical protein
MMYNLTHSQREILHALITLYNKLRRMIRSTEIAEAIGRDDGTVRNIISGLKAIGFIESKTGPAGGYRPTIKAYEYFKSLNEFMVGFVRVFKEDTELPVRVVNVEFVDVANPLGIKAVLKTVGDINAVEVDSNLRVGPIPSTRMIIEGKVLFIDFIRKEIIVDVNKIISIPKEPVKKFMSQPVKVINPNATVIEAAEMLYKEGIRGVPVVSDNGIVTGIITSADILKAVIEHGLDSKVTKYMRHPPVAIKADDDVLTAIRKMVENKVGRLVVIDDEGKPVGFVTRTDILEGIAELERLVNVER